MLAGQKHAQAKRENTSTQQNKYGLSVLAANVQVALQIVSRAGHDGQPLWEAVAHGAMQRVTLLKGQERPDGFPHRPATHCCSKLEGTGQAAHLAQLVVMLAQGPDDSQCWNGEGLGLHKDVSHTSSPFATSA